MNVDTYGQKINEVYRVLSDPFFERRLKGFDSRLKLMFDQNSERWVVLEQAYDNSGWNCVIKCENADKSPRPLGDWVFEKLSRYRQIYDLKRSMGVNAWHQSLQSEARHQQQKEQEKISEEHQAMLRDDLTQWRKVSKELQNQPASDATAGYRKVQHENV